MPDTPRVHEIPGYDLEERRLDHAWHKQVQPANRPKPDQLVSCPVVSLKTPPMQDYYTEPSCKSA